MNLPNDIEGLKVFIFELITVQEKLILENAQLRAENAQLRAENAQLRKRIEELELQVKQNSQNSHKPPSSDGYRKAAVLSPKKKKRQGGQLGHKGDTLKKIENPDELLELRPEICHNCGKKLSKHCVAEVYDTRQVADIPPVQLRYTEYQRLACTCGSCGSRTITDYPVGVNGEIQYGPNLRAYVTLLTQEYNLPIAKLKELLSLLFSCEMNGATIYQIQKAAYTKLAEVESQIVAQLQSSEKVHVDESGIRIEGKLRWLHSLSNEKFTYQFAHDKRGHEAHENTFLKNFSNWLIHDFWMPYLKFDKCRHGFCMAHIIRELQALIDQGSRWANRFKKFFLRLYEQTDEGRKNLSQEVWDSAVKTYKIMLKIADREEPKTAATGKRGRQKQTKGRNLLQRLTEYWEGLLAFAKYEIVPFTNNQAERDIRPCKSKMKVAGTFRAFDGAKAYVRIRGFISTAKKHQANPFNELVRLFNGEKPEFLAQYY